MRLEDLQRYFTFDGSGNIVLTESKTLTDYASASSVSSKQSSLSGASLTAVTVATDDKVLIQDTSDSNNLKTVTTQAIADLAAPSNITVANEATDTTCFPLFVTAATGSHAVKSNANLTFNSNTGAMGVAIMTANSDGLRTLDSGGSGFAMKIRAVDTLTADRRLNFTLNDAARTVTLSGDLTVGSGGASITGTYAAGTYTPTRSAESNLDSNITPAQAQYTRTGSTVTVSGRFTADPTLAATATSFELTLPIASNIGAVEDLSGVAFCGSIAGMGAEITGSVANNTAVFTWVSSDINSRSWSYVFFYEVI